MTLSAALHELALLSDDPCMLAGFYRDTLGYKLSSDEQGLLGVAHDRRLRFLVGPAQRLGYATYKTTSIDLTALKKRLQHFGIASEEIKWPGFQGASLRFRDPDENALIFGVSEGTMNPSSFSEDTLPAARLQHVVFSSRNAQRFENFYVDILGFVVSDRVIDCDGVMRTAFLRCGEEHHSIAVFSSLEDKLDHHCYESGEWNHLRDWADHFSKLRVPLKWGPGRHGPGNNLFLFIHDTDGNWVEISAELERIVDNRPPGNWAHEERTLNSWGRAYLRS